MLRLMKLHPEILKTAKKLYPIDSLNAKSLKNIYLRLRFLKRAGKQSELLEDFIQKMKAYGHEAIFSQEPYMLGLVEWPYMHNQWDLQKRVDTISTHYQILPSQPKFLDVSDGQPKKIIDLNEYCEGASVVIDRAKWFAREGEVVLNLFKGELRVKSIAFTLGRLDNELAIFVGAVQGIHADDDSLNLFKSITKDFEGLRPRSLVIELLRMVAERVGAKKIWAISDENRHHRHPYFLNYHEKTLKTHYDVAWLEHEAVNLGNGFFEVPVAKHRRDLAEVSSNKRAMYRRRYELLDKIEASLTKLQCFVCLTFFSQLMAFFSIFEDLEVFV
jgi:uncharacterized protein VirK/YbjX